MSDEQKIETEEEAEVEGHGRAPASGRDERDAFEDEAEVEGHLFIGGGDKRGAGGGMGRRGQGGGA